MSSIQLGPFTLQRPIGKGGMGEVWRGHHEEQGVPVAVKVMTAKVFEKEENRIRFNNEVRAVAQLDHPGIVWVFDYGTVTEEAAEASRGRLVAGSPYLAMEHASNGTLSTLRRPLAWPDLKGVLLELLDALAHAHAHGIVHRDLKPANVLMCGARDLRPGVKLTDFGIASADALEPANQDEVVGTLHYMSPEQIRGAAWMQGPHTDLYGLGCLAWRLSCGAVPFAGRAGVQLLAAQLHKRLPPLKPVQPVPSGFGDWIAALTAKDPADRIRRAADAIAALHEVGDRLPSGTPPPIQRLRRPAQDDPTHFTTPEEEEATVLALPKVSPTDQAPEHHALAQIRQALPATWERSDAARRSIRLVGAGLGLYGVRTIPMVGRRTERDALWQALHEVTQSRKAQVVVIRGSAGAGKSRLAEWLTRRSHEVGGATPLMARFQESGIPEAPLQRMLRRALRLGLDEPITDELLQGWSRYWGSTRDGVRNAVTTLLEPRPGVGVDRNTRHAMLRLALEEMCRERPLVLWLDDVQWGLDGLHFIHSLLEAQPLRPIPVLVVMTAREDALAATEHESIQLDGLVELEGTVSLTIPPLSRNEQARLVQELLGLEPALGAAVEERAAGNPLFAVQLVGDWVQRGLLVPGESGFELAPGAEANLPKDLSEVWSERIERLLENLPHDARGLLERAAIIGPEVVGKEWRMVCDGNEIVPRHEVIRRALLERLLTSRLAEETDTGWVFAHGLLQETLQESSKAGGRWKEHNRAAAWMLGGRLKIDAAERVGLFLLEAVDIDTAIDPLLRGISYRRVTVGRRSALRLIKLCENAMQGLIPENDMRWGRLLLEKAATLDFLGLPEAYDVARTLYDRAERTGWKEIQGQAAHRLGRHLRLNGDLDGAKRWHTTCLELVQDPQMRSESSYALSRIYRTKLDTERANFFANAAIRVLDKLGDPVSQALSQTYRAEIALFDHDWRRCVDHARQGIEVALDLGVRSRLYNIMAEALRALDEWDAAADVLRNAIEIADVIGQGQSPIIRANLAIIHLQRDDFVQADRVLHEALYTARITNKAPLMAIIHAMLVTTSAGLGNWAAFDDHATQTEKIQFELDIGEADCAEGLERAADLADKAGFGTRRSRALTLAADHWRKTGNPERSRALIQASKRA